MVKQLFSVKSLLATGLITAFMSVGAVVHPFTFKAEIQNNTAIIKISGSISEWRNSASDVESQVDDIVSKGIKDAIVKINTPGGDLFQANEIGNILKKFTGSTIAETGALCASAGTVIALHCQIVKAAKNGLWMIHRPVGGIEGNEDQVESFLVALRIAQNGILTLYSDKTGMSTKEISALWKSDYWMSAQQAKDKGFVDEVIEDVAITNQDITSIAACGYKLVNTLKATAITPIQTQTPNHKKFMEKAQICAMLGLDPNTADNIVEAKLKEMKVLADKTAQLENTVKNSTETEAKTKAESLVDAAIAAKKITGDKRDEFVASAIKSYDAMKLAIDNMSAPSQIQTATGSAASAEDRSKWSYEDYVKKDPQGLQKLANENSEVFKGLFRAHFGTEYKG